MKGEVMHVVMYILWLVANMIELFGFLTMIFGIVLAAWGATFAYNEAVTILGVKVAVAGAVVFAIAAFFVPFS